jgi:tRNA nucleotidyltransferase (CCA-adding enzyme)
MRLVRVRTKTTSTMTSIKLSLTPAETLFRQCLLECREKMHDVPGMQGLALRWTGGWVRDKLLGVQSHDIDVALSTMTGMQFGQAMQNFLKQDGAKFEEDAVKQGINPQVKDIHKIAANPEKSKHLETITTRMFGLDVDFVNLRKEVYNEQSRNPQMEFGSAEEDAMRRDACVNALFYNLDTQTVEDFTTRGLDDMKNKLLRTPLAPYQTFKDDPLRILRLIRFACRLDYQIEHEAQEAMKDKTIHEALRLKISRERVGVEIGKIMTGPDPYTGLKYINNFDLYETVFADPTMPLDQFRVKSSAASEAYKALKMISQGSDLSVGLKIPDEQEMCWFLAAYVPYYRSSVHGEKAAREGIKATNKMSKTLKDAIDLRSQVSNAVNLVETGEASRAVVGMLLRQCRESWRSHVLYSLLCDIVNKDLQDPIAKYKTFLDFVESHRLAEAYRVTPILNGNQIREALGGPKGGPWLKKAVDVLAEWQFDHPEATKDEAAAMIVSKKRALGLV